MLEKYLYCIKNILEITRAGKWSEISLARQICSFFTTRQIGQEVVKWKLWREKLWREIRNICCNSFFPGPHAPWTTSSKQESRNQH